jgi:hypothetical protein
MFTSVTISFFLLAQNAKNNLAMSPTKPLEFFENFCQKARVLDWVHQV